VKAHCLLSLLLASGWPTLAQAQDSMMHHGHHEGMEHGDAQHVMQGFYGQYPMSRESSGTAWVPDSSPMEGLHQMHGEWMTMLHGYATAVYDDQGGPRGDEKTFIEGMLMGMASRPLAGGTWGLRAMLSPDPAIGKGGYPLLLQTGETANGRTHLIDRQHPHDLFMELATSYSHPLTDDSSVFAYVGYPGEPALGPPTFMHRFSGIDNPEAPIGHHWLDSTHITFGVATLGYVWRNWKIEGSAFNGREPDQYRWNFDDPRFSSYAGRLSYNPTDRWSLQVSQGFLKSPEQLEPDVDQHRTTASAMYNLPFGGGNNWQTSFAWGRNDNRPGHTLDAYLVESAVRLHDTHTFFGRAERAEKNELFDDPSPLADQIFRVNKFSAGYVYDLPVADHLKLGVGGVGSLYALPGALDPHYGDNPASFMLFVRMKLN
jgi:hypothetical protein